MGQYRNREARSADSSSRPSAADLQVIIQGEPVASAERTNTWAKTLGNSLVRNGLTTSQIRNIFGQVRRIEMNWPVDGTDSARARASERDLILLQPKLAYQAKREADRKKYALDDLKDILIDSINLVQGNRGNFQRFVDFFEAILAYHKAAGGN